MAACETVEDVLKKETNDIEKTNESLTVIDVHRKPFTKSLAQSIHTWQGTKEEGEEGGRKFFTANVRDQCLVLEIS